jgi:hypothetical protein
MFILLQVAPDGGPPPSKAAKGGGDESFWVKDSDANQCQVSGAAFSLFARKHHCRATGKVRRFTGYT